MAITKYLEQKGIRLTSQRSSMNIRDRVAYSRGSQKGNGIGINTQVNDRTKSRMLSR